MTGKKTNGNGEVIPPPTLRVRKWLQAATAIGVVVSLVACIALLIFGYVEIQKERKQSATDTCYLIRSLVTAAPQANGTGAGTLDPQKAAYLSRVGLGDCVAFGNSVTHIKHQ